MSNHDSQLATLDATTLGTIHGGLPVGKLWKAAKGAYNAAAPVVKDAAKKVAPFLLPAYQAHNIYKRATDDK